ncbi:DUF4145 domain-containing protein [Variovorax sp. SRS16]|uniref:DUF4145 domain-containing protein n=1 Tax=Variovorax sp. SRS16 TaxID=282217 RepID=UPI0013A5AF08|nr:DUF4145 domain-containing protein [Variovorax sp. SRS16]
MIDAAPDDQMICIGWQATRCPAKACGKFVLEVGATYGKASRNPHNRRSGEVIQDSGRPVGIGNVRFEPRVGAPLSSHVPRAVVCDYQEAYLIKDLSPKAAATLCRRALQGMVRDRWGVSKGTLAAELEAIKDKCEEQLFGAIMGLKGVGNIGAHPERDINLIVDVEEGEVDSLLELLRILDSEWYVARAARNARLATVIALGASKTSAKLAVPPLSRP